MNRQPASLAPEHGELDAGELARAATTAAALLDLAIHESLAPVETLGRALSYIAAASGPVLAFCRSGTRSIMTWALGEAANGRDRAELVRLAADAGYDLAPVLGA